MIRKTWNTDKWLLTAQHEHARLSAIMAASWDFPAERPHEEVFKAIMHHDDGWRDVDSLPMVRDDGDPFSFHEIKTADAAPIYTRSIELRKESGHLYGTALVVGHFIALVESADLAKASTKDAIAAGQFLARQRAHLETLKKEVAKGETGAALLENYERDLRFLQVCDYLSLLLCTDFFNEDTIENVPFLKDGNSLRVVRPGNSLTLSLDPLPFKKKLRDHLASWVVPYIPYDSPEELKGALDEVKTITNEVHLGTINN
jgi:hypothetical protein